MVDIDFDKYEKKKKNDGKKSNEIQNGCVCTYTDDNIRIESICKQEICFWKNSSNVLIRTS